MNSLARPMPPYDLTQMPVPNQRSTGYRGYRNQRSRPQGPEPRVPMYLAAHNRHRHRCADRPACLDFAGDDPSRFPRAPVCVCRGDARFSGFHGYDEQGNSGRCADTSYNIDARPRVYSMTLEPHSSKLEYTGYMKVAYNNNNNTGLHQNDRFRVSGVIYNCK